MPRFQRSLQQIRKVAPRGWAPLVQRAAAVVPALQRYSCTVDDGERLVVDLREKMCYGYFFNSGLRHEAGTKAVLKHVLTPGAVFVDVGANIGYFTAMAARLVGPTGRVLAFEPLPRAAGLLDANAAPYPWAEVHKTAAGAEVGTATFSSMPSGDHSGFGNRPGALDVLTVPVTTLDLALADVPRVDLVKVDVEGNEPAVLQGALGMLRRLRPVLYLEALDGGASLRDVLAEADYRPATPEERLRYGSSDDQNLLALPA